MREASRTFLVITKLVPTQNAVSEWSREQFRGAIPIASVEIIANDNPTYLCALLALLLSSPLRDEEGKAYLSSTIVSLRGREPLPLPSLLQRDYVQRSPLSECLDVGFQTWNLRNL